MTVLVHRSPVNDKIDTADICHLCGTIIILISVSFGFFGLLLGPSKACSMEQQLYDFRIPEMPVENAVHELAVQSNTPLLFPYEGNLSIKANAVVGRMTVPGAVDMLLQNTGFIGRINRSGVLTIHQIKPKSDCEKIEGPSMCGNKNQKIRGFALLGSLLSAVQGVSAQESTAENYGMNTIEEIVVTARRREESAQSVPVSMTALSSQTLIEQGFKDVRSLTNLSPGLRVVSNGGGSTADITLRGMRRYGFGESAPPVVTYFAEVPMQSEGALFSTMDLENIQVLKGPQGTLFGRNTLAGAILISPKEPTHTLEGYLKAGTGSDNYRLAEAAINIPLVNDSVALRIAGQAEKRDGYVENVGVGSDWNDLDYQTFRASLLIEPGENFKNLTIYDYYKKDSAGTSAVPVVNLNSGVAALVTSILSPNCGTAIPDTTLCNYNEAFNAQKERGLYKVKLNVAPITEQTLWGLTNKTDINIGDITVRNIFGYREVENYTQIDADGLTLAIPVLSAWGASDVSQISNEFQVLGNALEDKIDWIVGAFYLKSEPEGVNAGRSDVIAQGRWVGRYYERENEALFAQAGYRFTDKLKLNLGYRITWEEASVCSDRESLPSGDRPVADFGDCKGSTTSITLEKDRQSTSTWSVGLDYQLNEDIFLYAVSRRGTREGSINLPDFKDTFFEQFQEFEQEKVTDIEVGIKSDLMIADMASRINVSAFTMIREDIQAAVNMSNLVTQFNANPEQFGEPAGSTVPLPDTGSLIINGGETRVDGVDAEFVLMPSDYLTVSLLGTYSNTSVREQVPSPFPGFVGTPSLVSPSPRWSAAANIRYSHPVNALETDLVVNISYFWTDEVLFGNDFIAPGYEVTDLRVRMDDIKATGLGVAAFINNIFDNEYYASSAAAASSLGFYTVNAGEPRMLGVEVSYQF